EVAPGAFERTPTLAITFEPGRFRNRVIEVSPFLLTGPEQVTVGRLATLVPPDRFPDEGAWKNANPFSLLGLPPHGGRRDSVRFLADGERLYVAARLADPEGMVKVKTSEDESSSRLVLYGEHVGVLLSDGEQTWTFAISPGQVRYSDGG